MKARDIVESWMWGDPGRNIERLLRVSDRDGARAAQAAQATTITPAPSRRDRYSTMARRIELRGYTWNI
jgi:hypothetical protein